MLPSPPNCTPPKHSYPIRTPPTRPPQEEVFGAVSELVQSALDGHHVCLFSYGQTGAGKTHTMQGSGSGPGRGIIPRAVEKARGGGPTGRGPAAVCLPVTRLGGGWSGMQVPVYHTTLSDALPCHPVPVTPASPTSGPRSITHLG